MRPGKTWMGVAALGAVMSALAAAPAAAIDCKNGYQLVQGNYVATPYCQDSLVAEVARQYGVRTSASAIRENPNHKRHVCQLIGNDIRVQTTCLDAGAVIRRGF